MQYIMKNLECLDGFKFIYNLKIHRVLYVHKNMFSFTDFVYLLKKLINFQ